MAYYNRWAGSGAGEILQIVVDTWRRVVGNQVRMNINAAHARGAKGGFLGGSRSEGVLSASAIEAPNYVPVTIDWEHIDGLTVIATVDVKTDNAGTSVTPRVRDVTNGVNHNGSASTSTSWDRKTITIAPPAVLGVVEYWFYLVPQNNTDQVFGIGSIEVFDELSGVA
jgi:hypothetical protein